MPEIDFVIAWVDGSDPAHVEKRRRFSPELENAHHGAASEARFRESGEIYYLIASILKYAPFVRRVYIVTDDQKPKWLDAFAKAGLCDAAFLQLVSHDVIFRGLNAVLPTFNSLVIEAAIWRIPDLAEHFVYSNDDMFLNAPLSPEDFFCDGRPVLHGKMTMPSRWHPKNRVRDILNRISGRKDLRPKHSIAQEKGARLAGMRHRFFYAPHHPHPMRRSCLTEFYGRNGALLEEQLKFRFRSRNQHYPIALANNLEIALHGTPRRPEVPVVYIRPNMSRSPERVLSEIRNGRSPFGCIQNLEKLSADLREQLHVVLRRKFQETLPPLPWSGSLAGRAESA